MEEYRSYEEIVTEFLVKTCRVGLHPCVTYDGILALDHCGIVTSPSRQSSSDKLENNDIEFIPMKTGSTAEFYIQPMLSCIGDADVMFYTSSHLAIPTGTAPPTELPDEFRSCVYVFEIVDSGYPGYVYLVTSYVLTECIDDGKYSAELLQHKYLAYYLGDEMHGPALRSELSLTIPTNIVERLAGTCYSQDNVLCTRCLLWPPQAADWPTRKRIHCWPDSAAIDRIVSNGCDVVQVAHRLCRRDEWESHRQFRLSFSRAEVALLHSWTAVQQIVYHMLRVFLKISLEQLTDSANHSDIATLNNYHVKTRMMWACELKPKSWWTNDSNFVRLSVELLHTLGVWLTDARCPHYFVHNCNLFDCPDNCFGETGSRLTSVTQPSLAEWFISTYIRRCARRCHDDVTLLGLFDDISNRPKLQKAVSEVIDSRLSPFSICSWEVMVTTAVQVTIPLSLSHWLLSLHSCLYRIRDLQAIDQRFLLHFTAVSFLHVAYRTTRHRLNAELLDVLATACVRSANVRRCRNARRSSVLSLSQAAKLMKVVANNSRSTVQLIEIELSKAYLYRALRRKDSDSDSIYCLANVYLAVLYYTTGHYQMAIDHCTLVTMSQDHSHCSSLVVQGELLPKIEDDIDNMLGLAVFYQYVRTAALNQQPQTQHVSVFTTELFAHYLHMRCLSVMKCRQFIQMSSTDEVQRYQKCIYESREIFTSDVLRYFVNDAKCLTNDQRQIAVSNQTVPEISLHLDTSELVELLHQSAVEHLTAFREREAQKISSEFGIVTTDFEALYAYKCGEYQRCLQLSIQNVRTLFGFDGESFVLASPEFIQLMDDDIVSLLGLTLLVDPEYRSVLRSDASFRTVVHQLPLSLYLMTQCQMKLHHPVTSLAQTLDCLDVARRSPCVYSDVYTLDPLLIKLIEGKILLRISAESTYI